MERGAKGNKLLCNLGTKTNLVKEFWVFNRQIKKEVLVSFSYHQGFAEWKY